MIKGGPAEGWKMRKEALGPRIQGGTGGSAKEEHKLRGTWEEKH